MWIIPILICTFGLFLYYKLRSPLKYWKSKGIPHPVPSIIVGNLGPVLFKQETYAKFLQRTCALYKDSRYFGVYYFSKPILIILDKELLKQIFIKKFEHFIDHSDFLPKDVDTFWKKGLFGRDGDDWQIMRTIISPAFTSNKMKVMFSLVAECSKRFVNHFLKKNAIITLDMIDAFSKLNNDVMASCTFGINCDSLENEKNQFYLIGQEAFNFTGLKALKFFGNAISPTLSKLFGVKLFTNKITDFFIRITQETISYRKKTGLYRPDVIHLLMEAQKGKLKYEEDNSHLGSEYSEKKNSLPQFKITDEDIASQMLLFFLGSHETITVALSNMIYELVAHMNVQNKLRKEVDYAVSNCNGKVTYEALMRMKYLDMVLSESLRLRSPTPFLNRMCVKPFVIEPVSASEKSFVIEPGTEIIVSIYTSHKNSEHFSNPDQFNPERFNDENKENIKACTYFPFGMGPRHCIGNRLALMIMKLILVNLINHFEIIPVEKTMIPMVESTNDLAVKSAHGYWCGLKPRTDKF